MSELRRLEQLNNTLKSYRITDTDIYCVGYGSEKNYVCCIYYGRDNWIKCVPFFIYEDDHFKILNGDSNDLSFPNSPQTPIFLSNSQGTIIGGVIGYTIRDMIDYTSNIKYILHNKNVIIISSYNEDKKSLKFKFKQC